MSFGFRAEVGYDPKKDVTFLRTNTPDFNKQLTLNVPRGSEEDKEIRALLEDQGIVNFTELNRAVRLPGFTHDKFGLVGAEEDDSLTLAEYDHLVLFGKEGSGAVNLMRLWILWAARSNIHIVSVSNPNLYGMEDFVTPALVHHLDPNEPLEEQFEESGVLDGYNREVLILIGADYEPTHNEDSEFIEKVQNGEYHEDDNLFSLIHRNLLPESSAFIGGAFFGSEGEPENVSYAVIGDVNERTAKIVGTDVPVRNPRGVAWFSHKGEESKRVRTYVLPRPFIVELLTTIAWI